MTGPEHPREDSVQAVASRTAFMKLSGAFAAARLLTAWCSKNGRRGESGSEVLEFALCANVFFAFVFGFMELCVVLFMMNSVAETARQAARWASVRGTNSSVTVNGTTSCGNPNITKCPAQASDIQTYADGLPGMSSANTTVTVNWCNSDGTSGCSTSESNAKPGNIVKVKVSYKFASVPFVSKTAITFSSTAEKVVWQ